MVATEPPVTVGIPVTVAQDEDDSVLPLAKVNIKPSRHDAGESSKVTSGAQCLSWCESAPLLEPHAHLLERGPRQLQNLIVLV